MAAPAMEVEERERERLPGRAQPVASFLASGVPARARDVQSDLDRVSRTAMVGKQSG